VLSHSLLPAAAVSAIRIAVIAPLPTLRLIVTASSSDSSIKR